MIAELMGTRGPGGHRAAGLSEQSTAGLGDDRRIVPRCHILRRRRVTRKALARVAGRIASVPGTIRELLAGPAMANEALLRGERQTFGRLPACSPQHDSAAPANHPSGVCQPRFPGEHGPTRADRGGSGEDELISRREQVSVGKNEVTSLASDESPGGVTENVTEPVA